VPNALLVVVPIEFRSIAFGFWLPGSKLREGQAEGHVYFL
jgi:hypothetical protein